MTEFLLVHGMGQGAWTWGKVWGRLTAPVEHPPRLQITRQAGRVSTLDLPGHGSDSVGDTAQVRMEECVHAIVRAVEREGLRDVVLVGHDFAGSLIAQAARQLTNPPKRLVMLAGIVPPPQRSMLAVLPTRSRAAYRLLDVMSKMSRRDLRLPPLRHWLLPVQRDEPDGTGGSDGILWTAAGQGDYLKGSCGRRPASPAR